MASTQIHRFIRIIEMLRTRQCVPFKLLQNEFAVTERTLFRDVMALSEAGIPIYYDRSVKGYRINNTKIISELEFAPQDLAIIYAGLSLLKLSVGSDYSKQIDHLSKKLSIISKFPSKGISSSFTNQLGTLRNAIDGDSLLTQAIIHAVLETRNTFRLVVTIENKAKKVILRQPRLEICKQSLLCGTTKRGNEVLIPINDIRSISIVPE